MMSNANDSKEWKFCAILYSPNDTIRMVKTESLDSEF